MPQGAPAASPPGVDWEGWRDALQPFAVATGLCVSAYDEDRQRQAGPYLASPVAQRLGASAVWESGGIALALEQQLVARVLASGRVEQAEVGGELRFAAAPIPLGGRVRGVIVHGWRFTTFSSPLGCERIARELGVDGIALWSEARLESPVPPVRMADYTGLLETLIATTSRYAEAMARLDELSRLREVFLAGVSHELRTPLSALSNRIELLLHGTLDDRAAIRASLLKMKEHVASEARLIEDLIEGSRTRTGQLSVALQATSLAAVLGAALAAIQPHAQAKQITLRTPTADVLAGFSLRADPHRLQQVFWNLLSNAIKFTPAGGHVELAVRSDANHHHVSVADSGRGIDPALRDRVFEPFARQREGNGEGLGLGLSIARHIVDLHGGRIWADRPDAGVGACFHVLLPRSPDGAPVAKAG